MKIRVLKPVRVRRVLRFGDNSSYNNRKNVAISEFLFEIFTIKLYDFYKRFVCARRTVRCRLYRGAHEAEMRCRKYRYDIRDKNSAVDKKNNAKRKGGAETLFRSAHFVIVFCSTAFRFVCNAFV